MKCFLEMLLLGGFLIGVTIFMQGCSGQLSRTINLKEPPTQNGPVIVSLGVYINSFYQINEKKMEYTVNMYYRESWKDSRIKFNNSLSKGSYEIPSYMMKKIWFPDVFMRNEKSSFKHDMMFDNRLLRFNKEGIAWHVRRITTTLSCPMMFQRFPFDTQFCPMIFESFSHTMDTLALQWLKNPVEIDPSLQILTFSVVDQLLIDCSQNYTTGAYPCLEIRFILRRDLGWYVCSFFLPTMFMVMVAWTSLWIKVNLTLRRIVVSSIALFFIAGLHRNTKEMLPMVAYLTAADLWIILCLVLVLCTIVEHVVIYFLLNLRDKEQEQQQQQQSDAESVKQTEDKALKADSDSEKQTEEKNQTKDKLILGLKNLLLKKRFTGVSNAEMYRSKVGLVNSLSMLFLAAIFILFVIVYFSYYTRV